MATMKLSLPEELTDVRSQVRRGYGTGSEYVRDLIRREQDRQRLREALIAGAISPATDLADRAYSKRLRNGVRAAAKVARGTGR